MPLITGEMCVMSPRLGKPACHTIELRDDPNYEFEIDFRNFVVEIAETKGVHLLQQGQIPT